MTGNNPDPTPKRSSKGDTANRSQWQSASLALSIPGLFIAGPLVGYALGWAAKTYWDGPDWYLGVGVLIGFVSGSYETYLILKRLSKIQDQKTGNDK